MKKFCWILGIAVVVIVGFYAVNAYIYKEKQNKEIVFTDGEHFGFVREFLDNGEALDFDSAVWLTGKEGEDSAIRAGVCSETTRVDCLPNEYFIENTLKKNERISVRSDAEVIMMTWKMEETGEVKESLIPLSEFMLLVNNPNLRWNKLPYTITIYNNKVTKIKEVYIP